MLEIKNLTKKFGNQEILSDFSHTFASNGIYAITGKSGAGKTTLLRMIAGLDEDFEGEISGGGIKNISFMFQEYRLFSQLSAIKNALTPIKNPSAEDEARAKKLLLALGFKIEDLKKFPRELSGGMKQRVSFVRALMKNAPVLLLDEATKEVDEGLSHEFLKIIKEEGERRLVILVTHKDEEIKILGADTISI